MADSQRIGITGASGFLGKGLSRHLEAQGLTTVPLGRNGIEPCWDPNSPTVKVPTLDAVIHLAGEPLAQRWSAGAKKRIMESRHDGTHNLAQALAALDEPPKTLISASAVGYYGFPQDDWVDEHSEPGEGFAAAVVQAWEAAAQPARDAGIRVAHPRIGVVLGHGGALKKMLTPFRFGMGGPIGSGQQWFPWISYGDVMTGIEHLITHDISGPANLVAPTPIRQRDFARTLGKALHRPAIAPLPGFMVKLLFGAMGKEVLLEGQRVRPTVLETTDFKWGTPTIEDCMQGLFGK